MNRLSLIIEIELLKRQLKKKEIELEKSINCTHSFNKPYEDFLTTPGYTIPGDEPGTMGVDWRGPIYVPSETKSLGWKRKCIKCGYIQSSDRIETTTVKRPIFND